MTQQPLKIQYGHTHQYRISLHLKIIVHTKLGQDHKGKNQERAYSTQTYTHQQKARTAHYGQHVMQNWKLRIVANINVMHKDSVEESTESHKLQDHGTVMNVTGDSSMYSASSARHTHNHKMPLEKHQLKK